MPDYTGLMGVGMPASQALALGNEPELLTCAGTNLGGATSVKTTNTELSAASSQTGAALQSTAPVGTPYYFFCSSTTSAVVYVPSGHYYNGVQNDTVTLAQYASKVLMQYKKSYWASY